MIKEMSIDLETYSDVDISKCGAYKYAESDNFEILLFGVSIDGGEVQVFDLACGDTIPDGILAALSDDTVTKWAFNANFERICLSHWLKKHHPEHFKGYNILEDPASKYLDPASWKCTMIWSAYMGLPLSLEGVGAVLKLQDQKMKEGKDLIKYFCCPCKPTKINGGRTRNLLEHAPDKWEDFKAYNKRDVEVEMAIKQRLSKFPVPDFIWDEYHLDQEINDRGIMLDMDVVKNAIAFDEKSKSELMISMQNITNLDNPNSVVQMKQWLSDHGIEAESLGKKDVAAMIKNTDGTVATALKLRLQLAKSSVKKYQATEVNGIKFLCRSGMLFIKLPSGRTLSYIKPRIGENRFGGESVTYEGIGSTKKWERIESYGPKFVENIVQAVSRDLLCFAMRNLSHCFICGHVHDELIIECSQDVDYKSICNVMSRSPDWMPDILIRGDGYETKFYKKVSA